ncbi:hypothetical protein IWX48DRAFT_622973 [Phyllosticta citricarpa]
MFERDPIVSGELLWSAKLGKQSRRESIIGVAERWLPVLGFSPEDLPQARADPVPVQRPTDDKTGWWVVVWHGRRLLHHHDTEMRVTAASHECARAAGGKGGARSGWPRNWRAKNAAATPGRDSRIPEQPASSLKPQASSFACSPSIPAQPSPGQVRLDLIHSPTSCDCSPCRCLSFLVVETGWTMTMGVSVRRGAAEGEGVDGSCGTASSARIQADAKSAFLKLKSTEIPQVDVISPGSPPFCARQPSAAQSGCSDRRLNSCVSSPASCPILAELGAVLEMRLEVGLP